MLIRIALLWEDLSASVFIMFKFSSSWLKFSTGRYKSVGLEEGTPYRLGFPNGLHDFIHVQAELVLVVVNIRISCDDYSLLNSRLWNASFHSFGDVSGGSGAGGFGCDGLCAH